MSFVFHFIMAGLVYTFSIKAPSKEPPLFARVVTPEELQGLKPALTSPPVPVRRIHKETAKEDRDIIRSRGYEFGGESDRKESSNSKSGINKDEKPSDTPLRNPEELIKLPGAITSGPSASSGSLAKLFDRDVIKEQVKRGAVKEKPPEITFDTKEFRYQGYMNRLKEKIESIWQYPLSAAQRGIYGDLYIRFSIKKDGSLGRVELVRTSGYRELDDAAMKALMDGAPYWPLPSEWNMDEFIIEGHFIYTLYGYYIR
ncbi:MAG: energy transducer TonB [Thermodesulfovibrionales bacterium]